MTNSLTALFLATGIPQVVSTVLPVCACFRFFDFVTSFIDHKYEFTVLCADSGYVCSEFLTTEVDASSFPRLVSPPDGMI